MPGSFCLSLEGTPRRTAGRWKARLCAKGLTGAGAMLQVAVVASLEGATKTSPSVACRRRVAK